MSTEGVDFANERPSGSALAAADRHFVIRYLSPNTANNPGKRLTSAEVKSYRDAGLDIGVVWETTTTRATEGKSAGAADANSAIAVARNLGFPADQVIFFAVDEDVSGPTVAPYFQGVAGVLGRARSGVYGSYRVCVYLVNNGIVNYAWQTYAWSSGQWFSKAQVQQYHNGAKVAGYSLDLCRAMTTNWGQWLAPGKEDDMPLTDADVTKIVSGLDAWFRKDGVVGPGAVLAQPKGPRDPANTNGWSVLSLLTEPANRGYTFQGWLTQTLSAQSAPALAQALAPLLNTAAPITAEALETAMLGALTQLAAQAQPPVSGAAPATA